MTQVSNSNDRTAKVAYEAPSVTKLGEFGSMTQHAGSGSRLDAGYAGGTAVEDLLFS